MVHTSLRTSLSEREPLSMGEACRVSMMSRARFRLHVKWRWVSFQVPHKQRRPKRDFLIFYPSTKPDSLFKEARVDWLLLGNDNLVRSSVAQSKTRRLPVAPGRRPCKDSASENTSREFAQRSCRYYSGLVPPNSGELQCAKKTTLFFP